MDQEDRYSDLSGPWTGVYDYPDHQADPVTFNAILAETAGSLSGEIIEPNTINPEAGKFLYASVSGTVAGSSVRFMKFYEDFDEHVHEVIYEGTVDPTLTLIEGRWTTIEETPWSGPFVMNRVRTKAAVQKEHAGDVAPR